MKVGIIGSGFGLYGLLPAFNSIEGCEVVAICGKRTERLVKYCESIGLAKIYADWREMLREEKLDAIAIAVMPSAQYQIAKAAIEKGIHVFAEKPLTADYAQAKELLALAEKNGVVTAVDFIFQEIGEFEKVKDLIETGEYGRLAHIAVDWDFLSYDIRNQISTWKTDVKEGGGALAFFSPHVLYYLEYFAGKIISAKSLLSHSPKSVNGAEVGVDALLQFEKGITGHMHVSCNAPGMNRHRVMFVCDKATIVLESDKGVVDGFVLAVHDAEGSRIIPVEKPVSENGEDERVKIVKKIATRFIDSCRSGVPMIPSFAEGVRVQELIEMLRNTEG